MQILRKAYLPHQIKITKVLDRLLLQCASQVEFFLGHFLLRVLSLGRSNKFSHFLMASGLVSTEFSSRKLLIPKTNFLNPAFISTVIRFQNCLPYWIHWFGFVYCLFFTLRDFPYFFRKSAIQFKFFFNFFRISYLSFFQRQKSFLFPAGADSAILLITTLFKNSPLFFFEKLQLKLIGGWCLLIHWSGVKTL